MQVSYADMCIVVSVQMKILQLGFVVVTAGVVTECSRRVRHLAAMVVWTFSSRKLGRW